MGIVTSPLKNKVILKNGVIFTDFGREKVEIIVHNGDPNGVITSKIGSLCIDYSSSGKLWQNVNGLTTWVEVGSTDSIYTNLTPTPVTIGGIPSGSTFSGKTLQEMFDMLLYPYQAPAFSSFSSSLFSSYEVGQSLSPGIATVNYSITNPSNISPNTGIQSTSIPGATFTNPNPINLSGSGSFTLNVPNSSNLPSPGTMTISLQGTNTQSGIFNTSGTMTWRYRIFYGNESNPALSTGAEVQALASNLLAANSPRTYSFPAGPGTYKWICYPNSMTLLTNFIDTGTSFPVPFEPPVSISVTNPYGVTTTYNCHRSTNFLGGAINIAAS
jgi:hypothetical protein